MGLKSLFFPKSDTEYGQGGPSVCANNHTLDPGWNGVCPYCDAIARKTTVVPPAPEATRDTVAFEPQTHAGPSSSSGASGPRRATMIDSSGGSYAPRTPSDTRRITGVLATFSWSASGELFPIREGKNTIGAGNLSEEGHRPCDVQITTDPEISKEHALILCRQGKYELLDLNSSNGTFLNGQMISTHAVELPDNARIKVGATVFQFLMVEHKVQPGEPVRHEPRREENFEPKNSGGPGRLTSID